MNNYKPMLREQSAAVKAKQREGRALVRPVSQVAFRLKPVAGQDRFAATVDTVLRWMKPRAGRDLRKRQRSTVLRSLTFAPARM